VGTQNKNLTTLVSALLLFSLSIVAPLVRADVVDGAPTYSAAKNAGLYVWRATDGTWHMRLASGSAYQSVTGGITSTAPFKWVSAVATEAKDTVARIKPGQINFNLNVSSSDFVDGVDFSVPDGAGLCLWLWGSFGNTVLFGSGAVPSTPLGVARSFDLLDNGGCVGKIRSRPGHYIALNDWDGTAEMLDSIRPGVTGLHKRYYWKDIEPAPGNYDFSAINTDLQLAKAKGVQLVAMIVDKTFTAGDNPLPPYLASYALPLIDGGYVSRRWSPYVIQRLGLLMQAMGNRFDANPNFEGVAIQESSLGISPATEAATGYAPGIYRDALIRILKNARATFPTAQVFWYMNFLEGGNTLIGDIANAIVPFKIAMGGPDVLPDNTALNTWAYPYYGQFAGRLTLFGSIQNASYAHLHANTWYPTKYWTMGELYWWAKTKLCVNYLFWNRKTVASPSDSYDWTYALPVIRYNPPPFN